MWFYRFVFIGKEKNEKRAYGYDGGTARTYKYSFDLNPNWVNGRLESVNFFCPFFCLETKETKVQGCEKKAKKRLRSAKVVKLAQQNEFAAKHIYHKLSQSSRPQTVLCSNSDDFLTLSPSFFFTLCFSMPLAAALGICCGFSQPNDFFKKIGGAVEGTLTREAWAGAQDR